MQGQVLSRRTRPSVLRVVCGLVAAVLLAVFSFLPLRFKELLHTKGHLHSWGHLLAFVVLGALLTSYAGGMAPRLALSGGLMLFGLGLEYFEYAFYHGPMEYRDVLVDAIGVVLGVMAGLAMEQFDSAGDGGRGTSR